MRVLSALGLCEENGIDTYSANAVTEALALTGIKDGVKGLYSELSSGHAENSS